MPADLPPARSVRRAPVAAALHGTVALDYEGRLLRRKRLVTVAGEALPVDLPEVVSLKHGDALELADGRLIGVEAAPEALIEVRGDLPRLAWHIGNRHTPCRIEPDRLLIRHDHVLRAMLVQLGAAVTGIEAPFAPEGGAYGHGRTMGHGHGHGHGHDHGPSQDHSHDHDHPHVHHHGSHAHGPDEDDIDGPIDPP